MSRVVLVGLRGTGKSTVGALVAAALGWPFADCDDAVQQSAGRSVAAIFEIEGEAGFRARESAALAAFLARDPLVVATGGGAVLSVANRALIRGSGLVVWLRADPATLAARLAADPRSAQTRPALTPLDPVAELRSLAAAREPLYRAVAGLELDAGRLSPAAVAGRIVDTWHDSGGD